MKDSQIGPMNEFPRGKLNDDDHGALRIAIGLEKDCVMIKFGIPTEWIAMPKANAIDFANTIIKQANKLPE